MGYPCTGFSQAAPYLRRARLNSSVSVPILASVAAACAGDDVGPDAPGLPVIVGDLGMHDGERALRLLAALGRVGD